MSQEHCYHPNTCNPDKGEHGCICLCESCKDAKDKVADLKLQNFINTCFKGSKWKFTHMNHIYQIVNFTPQKVILKWCTDMSGPFEQTYSWAVFKNFKMIQVRDNE